MKPAPRTILASAVLAALAVLNGSSIPARAAAGRGFRLEVVVNGQARPEFRHGGAIYIEALRGCEYSLRLSNPLGCRAAVALAVDGLNTIDADHGDARSAAKWVLGPYETIEIPGWQVSSGEARRFTFTGEGDSYGAWLGETENLGVIEAVFYRERTPVRRDWTDGLAADRERSGGAGRAEKRSAAQAPAAEAAPPDDDYAATGIGRARDHAVHEVEIELEDAPAAAIRIRYEFEPELRRLGVLPRPSCWPADRRARASGFETRYCPAP